MIIQLTKTTRLRKETVAYIYEELKTYDTGKSAWISKSWHIDPFKWVDEPTLPELKIKSGDWQIEYKNLKATQKMTSYGLYERSIGDYYPRSLKSLLWYMVEKQMDSEDVYNPEEYVSKVLEVAKGICENYVLKEISKSADNNNSEEE